MDLFIYIPEFPIVICKICKFGHIANEVRSYLQRKHTTIPEDKVNIIIEAVDVIPGIIRSQAGLYDFLFSPPTIDPIQYIKPLETNGLQCHICDYII